MSDHGDVVLRALSGQVARQQAERRGKAYRKIFASRPDLPSISKEDRIRILDAIEAFYSDLRYMFITDVQRRSAIEQILSWDPTIAIHPGFSALWDSFLQEEWNRRISIHGDSISTFTLAEIQDRDYSRSFADMSLLLSYMRSNPGRMMEIIGLMGSGKTNAMVHQMLQVLKECHVISNVKLFLDDDLKVKYHVAYFLTDAVRMTAEILLSGYSGTIFYFIDEQGSASGNTSGTSTRRESTWWKQIRPYFRKLHIFYVEARQVANMPEELTDYITVTADKNRSEKEVFEYSFTDKEPAYAGNSGTYKVPDVGQYYDTYEFSPFVLDLDMKKFKDCEARMKASGMDDFSIALKCVEVSSSMKEKPEVIEGKRGLKCLDCGNIWESSQTGPVLTCSKCKGHKVEANGNRIPVQIEIHAETAGVPLVHETAATQGEGSWGTSRQEVSGRDSGGVTALLNTENGDLPGQNSQNHPESKSQAIEAAEDLAADAFNVFLDVATDPAKMKALEWDPELNVRFKQLMNTRIPDVDIGKVTEKAARKRKWSEPVPELQEKSMKLRQEASEKGECASCGKKLGGNQIYYCGEDCKSEFYSAHPTSVRWNDLRSQALRRDQDKCVKCGKPAEEVDHIREIWEGGPEFDLENLQSLCHVQKTNENRRRKN